MKKKNTGNIKAAKKNTTRSLPEKTETGIKKKNTEDLKTSQKNTTRSLPEDTETGMKKEVYGKLESRQEEYRKKSAGGHGSWYQRVAKMQGHISRSWPEIRLHTL